MSTGAVLALAAIVVVTVVTVVFGFLGTRVARSTDDFLAASRTVGSRANAAAISGQYVAAAAFLGIAGAVLSDGVDGLWFPLGFVAGFLALLLFVAAPLRRSGAYTVPDFAEARLDSAPLRTLTTIVVVAIGWLYLLPQLQASGLTLEVLLGVPPWVGVVAVGLVVTASVTFGGMRSLTVVQALRFWFTVAAIAVPTLVLVVWLQAGRSGAPDPDTTTGPPTFPAATDVDVRTPVALQIGAPVALEAVGRVDGTDAAGAVRWGPGRHEVAAGTTLRFGAGAPVPVVVGAVSDDAAWARPARDGESLLGAYSLLAAMALGTMGLPHVLVRFYTNPDGRTARRTTVLVLAVLGVFVLFPMLLGAISRVFVPRLLVDGSTDAAVLLLPQATLGGGAGAALGAVVAAGVFAALLAVSSGLVLAVAGVLSSDLLPGRAADFRVAAHVAGIVPLVAALLLPRLEITQTVSTAFVLAASTFCPLLVLGIWWRGLTDRGAIAGVAAGGGLAGAAVAATLLGATLPGWPGALLAQPALVTVPVAFAVMVLVSRATSSRVPPAVARTLMRLHAPERLGLGDLNRAGRPSA